MVWDGDGDGDGGWGGVGWVGGWMGCGYGSVALLLCVVGFVDLWLGSVALWLCGSWASVPVGSLARGLVVLVSSRDRGPSCS